MSIMQGGLSFTNAGRCEVRVCMHSKNKKTMRLTTACYTCSKNAIIVRMMERIFEREMLKMGAYYVGRRRSARSSIIFHEYIT